MKHFLIFFLILNFEGLFIVAVNYRIDYEKQLFRATNGNCRLWGKPAKSMAAFNQISKRTSTLLVSKENPPFKNRIEGLQIVGKRILFENKKRRCVLMISKIFEKFKFFFLFKPNKNGSCLDFGALVGI